jgi:phage terminase large subunit
VTQSSTSDELARLKVLPVYFDAVLDNPAAAICRTRIIYGGAGSGKSRFVVQYLFDLITSAERQGLRHRILALRKVQEDLSMSVFTELVDAFTDMGVLDSYVNVNRSSRVFTFPGGSQIYCSGLDRVDRKKSLASFTGVWMEEATDFTEYDYDQLNLRLRGKSKLQKFLILTFNPIDRNHWIYKRFFDDGNLNPPDPTLPAQDRLMIDRNICALHTTYTDNFYLDDEYITEVEAYQTRDNYLWLVYGLGAWSTMGTMILTNWFVDPKVIQQPRYDQNAAGLDFGYTHPSALLRMGMKDGELYVWQELYKRGLTNTKLIAQVSELEPTIAGDEVIIADSAEPARIEEFKGSGSYIRGCEKGAGSVLRDIDWLKDLPRIHVHPSCVGLIEELRGWHWRKLRDGTILEEPVGKLDDACAAMRYGTQPFRKPTDGSPGYKGKKRTRYSVDRGY